MEQPLLSAAENSILDEGEVDEIEESKRQNSVTSYASSNENEADAGPSTKSRAFTYLTSGTLGVFSLLFVLLFSLTISALATNWIEVRLDAYEEGSSSHTQTTILELTEIDFVKLFLDSDCHIFYALCITSQTVMATFLKLVLQGLSGFLYLSMLLFKDNEIGWAERRWNMFRNQSYYVSVFFMKLTQIPIYIGGFLVAVSTLKFHIESSVIETKFLVEAGLVLYVLATLISQLMLALMTWKIECIVEDHNTISRDQNGGNVSVDRSKSFTSVAPTEGYDTETEGEFYETEDYRASEQVHVNDETTSMKMKRYKTNFLGALAFVTGIVMWFLPILKVEYNDLESNFLNEDDRVVEYTIWSLLHEVYESLQMENELASFFLMSWFVIESIMLPVIVLVLSLALSKSRSKAKIRIASIIRFSRIFMNVDSLFFGVLFFGASVEKVFYYVFDDFDVCDSLIDKTDTPCISINCKFMTGTWILLFYMLSLNFYTFMVTPVPDKQI